MSTQRHWRQVKRWGPLLAGAGGLLLLSGCKGNSSQISSSTNEAEAAGVGSFPGVVTLLMKDTAKKTVGYCSGVFVRDDLVLTTAHCFTDNKFATVMVSAASGPLHNAVTIAATFLTQPKFDPSQPWAAKLPHDIGLAQFASGTAPVEAIVKIATAPPAIGAPVTMLGYATAIAKDPGTVSALYQLTTKIGSINTAAGNALITVPVAIAAPKASLFGVQGTLPAGALDDSGGPLLNAQGELVGLSEGTAGLDSAGPPPKNAPPAGTQPKVFYFVNTREQEAAAYISEQLNLGRIKPPTPEPAGNAQPQANGQGGAAPAQPQGAPAGGGVYTDPTSGQTFSYCNSAASADSRFPGWGYENNQSCKLPG